jgi:hypothetical protein
VKSDILYTKPSAHFHIDSDNKITCCWNYVSETPEKCPICPHILARWKKVNLFIYTSYTFQEGIYGEYSSTYS